MTRLRFEDLSPTLQAQVKAVDPSGAIDQPARAGKVRTGAPEGKAVLVCHDCGREFTTQTGEHSWQCHADTVGHHRYDLILNNQEGQ